MTRWPPLFLAVALYLATLPFLPPQAAALILLAVTILFAVTSLRHTPIDWADLWPVLPFLATSALAAARAENPVLAAGFLSFQVPGVILYVLATTDRSIDARSWKRLWSLFCLVIAASILIGRLRLALGAEPAFGEDIPQAILRLSGNSLLAVPNDVCLAAILVAFPLGLLATGARKIEQALCVLTLAGVLLAIILERSRTGLLIAAVEIALAAMAHPGLRRTLLPLLLAAAASDLLLGHAGLQKLLLTDAHNLHGIAGRLGLWVSAWRMFLAAPLLGDGAQSFGPAHFAYLPDWAPRYPEGHAPWAHNLFLDILAEQGILGAAALLCLIIPTLRAVHRALPAIDAQIALWALAGLTIAASLELTSIRRAVPLLVLGLVGFGRKARGLCPLDPRQGQGPWTPII